jgi:tRNA-Thr(GGU) m(6)t(6)A37 methyltransferase TsaA
VSTVEEPPRHGEVVIDGPLLLEPIGQVESTLLTPEEAPLQGDEGAPDAWLVMDPAVSDGLRGLRAGMDVLVLTWLDRASRDVLTVHPRGDLSRPATGVFNTRSPDRPNPIGLHGVTILAIEGTRIHVRNLEAVDRTPVLDVKPVLGALDER